MNEKIFHITMLITIEQTDKKATEKSVERALKYRLKDFAKKVSMSVVELPNKKA